MHKVNNRLKFLHHHALYIELNSTHTHTLKSLEFFPITHSQKMMNIVEKHRV